MSDKDRLELEATEDFKAEQLEIGEAREALAEGIANELQLLLLDAKLERELERRRVMQTLGVKG